MLGDFPIASAPLASTPVTTVSIAVAVPDPRDLGDVAVGEALGQQ